MRRTCSSDVLLVCNKRKACKEFFDCVSAIVECYLIAGTNNSPSAWRLYWNIRGEAKRIVLREKRHDPFYLLYCCKILMAIWILSEKISVGVFSTVFRRLADGYGNWWCNFSDKEAKLIARNYQGLMFPNQFAWNSLYCPQIKHDYTSSMKSV
jgi:hypothetical protein